ncbi:hypothetical protein AVEN_246027-1 [Araneus ventricosus]|uniref:Uncharacterized protein n=1 Tax=Araneus ventricosus TaxID=182803 RepID=A0A4Y2U9K6_ARAVE|nr:hypothetical protein AVEN_246027-1 [Araneus ventricosus]
MAKSYLKNLSKLCVSDNIRWARDIYVEHITGIRQFDESAIIRNPNFRPQEQLSQDDPLWALSTMLRPAVIQSVYLRRISALLFPPLFLLQLLVVPLNNYFELLVCGAPVCKFL